MEEHPRNPAPAPPRVGRPRRGTELERMDALFEAATRVFLREGYSATSIDKVASEAGVSTRTIYERVKNKADLLGAVMSRLVDRDLMQAFAPEELARLSVRDALLQIGRSLTGRTSDPDSVALFRIMVTEGQRFPELAAKLRTGTKERINSAIAQYLRGQVTRGSLSLPDVDRAATLFAQMVCTQLTECLLFGETQEMASFDYDAHLLRVIDLFLNGALPRGERRLASEITHEIT
jgi:AcrR family transcriptional regulator